MPYNRKAISGDYATETFYFPLSVQVEDEDSEDLYNVSSDSVRWFEDEIQEAIDDYQSDIEMEKYLCDDNEEIRDAMDLRASDVISFEYGSFGEDVIVLRRELCADGGLDDCEYPCNPNNPDGGEFADELEDEPNEDLEVKALLDFISGFSEKAQRSALMQVLLLLPGENGKDKS